MPGNIDLDAEALDIPFINLENHMFFCLRCFKEVIFNEDKCHWCSNSLNWEGIEAFEEDRDNDEHSDSDSESDSDSSETKSEIAFRTGTETSDSEASNSSSDSESCIELDDNNDDSTSSSESDSDGVLLSVNRVPSKRQRNN